MKLVIVFVLSLVGCDPASTPRVPSCTELGCPTALCSSRGMCTCKGTACTLGGADAGVSHLETDVDAR